MSKSAGLRLTDVRFIHTLIGECGELGDDPNVWRAHLFSKLGRLTSASLVVGGEAAFHGEELNAIGTVSVGWEHGFNRVVLSDGLAKNANNLLYNPHFKAYFQRFTACDGTGLTRQDVIPDGDWERSTYFEAIHQPMGVGHTLVSFVPIPGSPGELSGFGLCRGATERRNFYPRDQVLVRETHAALASIVGGPLARFAEPSPSGLPPRVRRVLQCLLEGDADKQIAARLEISPATVNVHTKAIYRHFGVRSRAELLARWVRNRWGSRCVWADPK